MPVKITRFALAIAICGLGSPLQANDWENFYTALAKPDDFIASSTPPEFAQSSGDVSRDVEQMYRRGFGLIGYSLFNTGNSKTKDAEKLAKKLKVRYLIVSVDLTSSSMGSLPLTLPNSTMSTTNGSFSSNGSGGSRNGTFSGTTTTYGSQTTYIPFMVNRFDKLGMFFAELPKLGVGVALRDLTEQEVSRLETRRAFAVRFVRDYSPAYYSDILPGDIITHVNGTQVDPKIWWDAIFSGEPLKLTIMRNWTSREVTVTVPLEWRTPLGR